MIIRLAVSALVIFPLAAAGQGDPVAKPLPTRTVATRPAPPANLTASITAPGQVTLTWDAVPGASAYDLGVHVSPDGWRRVTRITGGATSYVHGGRDLMKPHVYQVVAIVGDLASLPARSDTVVQTAVEPANDGTTGTPTATTSTSTSTPTSGTFAGPAPGSECTQYPGWVSCKSEVLRWTGEFNGKANRSVKCPSLHQLVGGGYEGDYWGMDVLSSFPVGPDVWRVELRANFTTAREGTNNHIAATIVCVPLRA